MSIARSRAFDRKRKAVCGPDIMTGRRSAEEQNLSHYIAEYPELARLLSDLVSGPCFAADELPLPATTGLHRAGNYGDSLRGYGYAAAVPVAINCRLR